MSASHRIDWLGSYEVVKTLSLKQQGQLLCATAAHRVLGSTDDFTTIEDDVLVISNSIGLNDAVITIQRVDAEVVESVVTIDVSKNSMLGSVFQPSTVSTSYFSFREE